MTKDNMAGRIVLGRYQVVRLLGEGGTSRVYLARQLDGDHRQVVVKILLENVTNTARLRDCFQREMFLLSRFQHPHTVAFYDSSLTDPVGPCLIMEYIPGVTLADVLEQHGRLTPLRTGRLLAQICSVLQAAHGMGIIHRDLKPGNLMVVGADTPGEKIKVMDFGLAHLNSSLYIPLDHLTRHGRDCAAGTPEYISPEEIRRDPVDHRADLYSLGVILYQMLTGHLPFNGSLGDLLDAHTRLSPPPFARYAPAARIAAPVEQLVQACLAKYAVERPESARALIERYEKALGHRILRAEDREAPPPPPPEQLSTHDIRIDRHTVVRHIEAYMPPAIAAVKLRGFVDEASGEAIESVPGLIRVRLGGRPAQPTANQQSLLGWLRIGAKATDTALIDRTEMELHMQKKESGRANITRVTVLLRPEGGSQQASDPEWQAYCDKIYRDLNAYLMGR